MKVLGYYDRTLEVKDAAGSAFDSNIKFEKVSYGRRAPIIF